MPLASTPQAFRTIFLSDIHLGLRSCRSDSLVDFLHQVQCEKLYLVGDIIDGWRLRRSWYWDSYHDEVIRLILRMARHGTEVIYIPGNHDELFRDWLGLEVAGVKLAREAVVQFPAPPAGLSLLVALAMVEATSQGSGQGD
jgi:UDP-2,3-diacylglucosamine pyrophosphatase LpxH